MKRTLTGSAAILASWIALFSGISLAAFFYSSKSWSILSIILATSFVVSIILRLLANMNEFLFSMNSNSYSLVNKIDEEARMFQGMSTVLQESNQTLQAMNKEVQESNQTLQGVNTASQKINQEFQNMNAIIQEINSDSKSINKRVCSLTSFFEEIERHLNLKK